MLLQVTSGCSYNRCAFCNMYKTVEFEPIPMKEILADLKDAAGYNPYTERVFLVGGEPLCLPFEQMREILIQIKKHLPYCACVSMYASIKNLRDKTAEQLKELHRLGLGFLYIGLESGSDRILAQMKKGHTAAEAVEQLKKLNQAQIPFNSILIYGLGRNGNRKGKCPCKRKDAQSGTLCQYYYDESYRFPRHRAGAVVQTGQLYPGKRKRTD